MVVENYIPFSEWLLPGEKGPGALVWFIIALFITAIAGIFLGYLAAAFRHGPVEAVYIVARAVGGGVVDLARLSPRRVWAMARLTMKEALRRKVLVVFALFALVLLFAGWFLDTAADHPGRLYLGFVLGISNLLVLVLAVVLSTMSLPADIKTRTIYTLVTKPLRAGEIVLGRIIGFAAIGTGILAAMALCNYLFVVRGLDHAHRIDPAAEQAVKDEKGAVTGYTGETSLDDHHRHKFEIDAASGEGFTDMKRGHRHTVKRTEVNGEASYALGPPVGELQARVPLYGKLHFLDRQGRRAAAGVNVGDEWMYRSYIEGQTLAAAIWTFEGVTAKRFVRRELTEGEKAALEVDERSRTPEERRLARAADLAQGLPLELNLSVFRTHKGDIEKPIPGALVVRNPKTGWESEPQFFLSQEFSIQQITIPRIVRATGPAGERESVDLYETLTDNGRMELRLQCLDEAQYFGAAQADVYLRAADSYFALNFAKGYAGVWVQMVLMTAFGVMFSTFLNMPVSMLATAMSYVIGYNSDFIFGVSKGEVVGGGLIESIIRMVTQQNNTMEFDPGVGTTIIKSADFVILQFLQVAAHASPKFQIFNTAPYVSYGYDIEWGILAQQVCVMGAYLLVISAIGYFCLKSREIAA
jgi:hypothetical protein